MIPDFSTWLKVRTAKPGDPVLITNRAHFYASYCCWFDHMEGDIMHIRVPFGSYDEYCTAPISEVRFK